MKWTVAILVVLAGCVSEDNAADDPVPALHTEAPLRFLAIGDGGTGNENQYRVAAAMEQVCAARGCDFVLGLGDNIYEDGPTGAYDEQFETKFEQPYANFTIPFWMALGNHDNGGGNGADAAGGDVEVEYAKRTDRTSDKWQMPHRWYSFEQAGAKFIALDSGPQTTNMAPAFVPGVHARELSQAEWLAAQTAVAHDGWVFAFDHHPYISNGQHGNAGTYDGIPGNGLAWKTLLEDTICGHADVLFSGHDHDLQWLEPTAACDTEFIISGAAGKTRGDGETGNPARFEVYDTFGFWWVEVDGDELTAVAFDDAASPLFERTMQRS